MSPTQLSLRHLRAEGYVAAVVEKWNTHVRIRQDLFGFIDIIAIKPGETLAVQCTSDHNVPAHAKKMGEAELLPVVLDAGWKVTLHGWAKEKNRWVLKREFHFHD